MLFVQTLMLSRALRADVSQCYGDIQQKVNEEHERNEELSAKVEALEAQLVEVEVERATLREELKEQKSARALLEVKSRPRENYLLTLAFLHGRLWKF